MPPNASKLLKIAQPRSKSAKFAHRQHFPGKFAPYSDTWWLQVCLMAINFPILLSTVSGNVINNQHQQLVEVKSTDVHILSARAAGWAAALDRRRPMVKVSIGTCSRLAWHALVRPRRPDSGFLDIGTHRPPTRDSVGLSHATTLRRHAGPGKDIYTEQVALIQVS